MFKGGYQIIDLRSLLGNITEDVSYTLINASNSKDKTIQTIISLSKQKEIKPCLLIFETDNCVYSDFCKTYVDNTEGKAIVIVDTFMELSIQYVLSTDTITISYSY